MSREFRNLTLFLFFTAAVMGGKALASGPDSAQVQLAADLARKFLLVDTHIDLPSILLGEWRDITVRTTTGDFDYIRAREGGLDVPFMSIYVSSRLEGTGKAKPRAEAMIDVVQKIVSTWPDKFDLVTSTAEVREKRRSGKILLAMGMENGAPIEGDLANLTHFHRLGIRYITLAHAKWNHICDASYDSVRHWNGLSPFGADVVKEMNRLGIMVDISHLSDSAAFHAIKTSRAPVIASHSSCRAFTPGFERNISDDLIRAVAAGGGVVQINFGSDFVNDSIRVSSSRAWKTLEEEMHQRKVDPDSKQGDAFQREFWKRHPRGYATVADVAAHVDHVRKLVGVEYVGLGSDFDGVGDTLPTGLKDVSQYPNLIAALLARGFSESDIEKVCGGNLLRVWTAVETVAAGGDAR
jgi:membrane dipeptidase